jgi:hypothetical protein
MLDNRIFISQIKRLFRYNINHQTPDSAATATAYLCGVKARLGTIGVDGRAKRRDCLSSIGAHVSSVLDWAQQSGKIFVHKKKSQSKTLLFQVKKLESSQQLVSLMLHLLLPMHTFLSVIGKVITRILLVLIKRGMVV